MNQLKFILKNVLCIVYGWVSAFYTPTVLLVVFNFMHGVANNPDGEMFVPFGILNLLVILIIDILIIFKTVMSKSMKKFEKALIISLFVIAKFAGLLMVEQNDLLYFTECFKEKYMTSVFA